METALKPLDEILRLNTDLALNCLAGLSEADAKARPLPAANSVAFLMVHLVDARFFMGKLLGCPGDNPLAEDYADVNKIEDAKSLPSLKELREAWLAASTHLAGCLDRATLEELAAPSNQKFPVADKSVLGGLAFLVQHDSYHLGQLAILRRGLGRGAMSYERTPLVADG